MNLIPAAANNGSGQSAAGAGQRVKSDAACDCTFNASWAFKRLYSSESARRKALPAYLHEYNHHRPHTARPEVQAHRGQTAQQEQGGADEFARPLGRVHPALRGLFGDQRGQGGHRCILARPAPGLLGAVAGDDGSVALEQMQVRVEHRFPQPSGLVWRLLTDVERVAGLGPEHTQARWVDPRRGTGARFVWTNRRDGRVWEVDCQVLSWRSPNAFAWVQHDGGLSRGRAVAVSGLAPVSQGPECRASPA